VTADRADEVHLHGYDRKVDIEPGTPAVLEFQADTRGCSGWSWKRPR
jgi:hypothetical protein